MDDNKRSVVYSLLPLSIICFFVLTTAMSLTPEGWQPRVRHVYGVFLFVAAFMYTYFRMKDKLYEELILTNSDTQPRWSVITLVMLKAYFQMFCETLILMVLLYFLVSLVFMMSTVLCETEIDTEFKKRMLYIPWLLYGWIEVLGMLLVGGKFKDRGVINWIGLFNKATSPNALFSILQLANIMNHVIPFLTGSVFIFVYMCISRFTVLASESPDVLNHILLGFLFSTISTMLTYLLIAGFGCTNNK